MGLTAFVEKRTLLASVLESCFFPIGTWGPLCLVDRSFLGETTDWPSSLTAVWLHTDYGAEHCLRWVADMPRFLNGFHVFGWGDGDCILDEDTFPIQSGAYINFSATQGDYQLHIAQARSTCRMDSSHDESFFVGADDNRRGLFGGAELSQAGFGKLVQQIKALKLDFEPALNRAVLLADSKTCTKLAKGLEALVSL